MQLKCIVTPQDHLLAINMAEEEDWDSVSITRVTANPHRGFYLLYHGKLLVGYLVAAHIQFTDVPELIDSNNSTWPLTGHLPRDKEVIFFELEDILIVEEWRKRGYARWALTKLFEEQLTRGTHTHLWQLNVKCDDLPTIKFYESLGFMILAIQPDYYDMGEHAYLMQRVTHPDTPIQEVKESWPWQ